MALICNIDGSCSQRCQQGKDCDGSLIASRRVLGLHRIEPSDIGYEAAWLEQRDGGESVNTDSHPWKFYCIAGIIAVAALASPAFFL